MMAAFSASMGFAGRGLSTTFIHLFFVITFFPSAIHPDNRISRLLANISFFGSEIPSP
jgi:hypothetical protein